MQQASGADLNLDYLHYLGGMLFSGCTLADFGNAKRGLLVHYLGKLVYAQHESRQGAEALDTLLKDASKASVTVFRVLPALLLLGLAPAMGKVRVSRLLSALKSETLMQALQTAQFNGAVVLELLSLASSWYVREGQLFQSQAMPPSFNEGTLYLFDAPSGPSQDLLQALFTLEQARANQKQVDLEPIWQAAEAVLKEYLGQGAGYAFERIRKQVRHDDVELLQAEIKKRLEGMLGKAAVQRFVELRKEL